MVCPDGRERHTGEREGSVTSEAAVIERHSALYCVFSVHSVCFFLRLFTQQSEEEEKLPAGEQQEELLLDAQRLLFCAL